MNDYPADAAGLRQTHVVPCFAGIDRLIDSVTHHVTVADYPGFAGSRPHRAGIGRCHCESTDGGDGLLVKDRHPAISAIRRFPDPPRRCSGVIHAGVSRYAGHGGDSIPHFGPTKRNRNWLSCSESGCCAPANTALPKIATDAKQSPSFLMIIMDYLRSNSVNAMANSSR